MNGTGLLGRFRGLFRGPMPVDIWTPPLPRSDRVSDRAATKAPHSKAHRRRRNRIASHSRARNRR